MWFLSLQRVLRAEKCSSNHLKHNDSRGAFLKFCKGLRAGKKMDRIAKCKTRKSPSKTIGFHDRNGGPKGHFVPKAVLNPLQNIGREHGVGRVAQNVCLPVVFQRFRGAQNALWRPEFSDRERERDRTEGCRLAPGGGGGGRRPAGRASAVRGQVSAGMTWKSIPFRYERSAPPPYLFPFTPILLARWRVVFCLRIGMS